MVTNEWHSFFKTFVIGYVDIPESRTSNHLQLWQCLMIHSWNKYSMFSGQKGNKIRFVIKSEKMDWVSYWWYSTEDHNPQKEVKSPYVDDQVSWGTWLLQPHQICHVMSLFSGPREEFWGRWSHHCRLLSCLEASMCLFISPLWVQACWQSLQIKLFVSSAAWRSTSVFTSLLRILVRFSLFFAQF